MTWRKTLIFSTAFLLILCLPGNLLFADLGDFGDEVEKEQREAEEREDQRNRNRSDDDEYEYDSDGDDDGFFDFLASITFLLWYYHNGSSWYPDYPYQYGSERPASVGHDWDTYQRRSRFSFSAAGGTSHEGGDLGISGNARFSAMIGGVIAGDLEYRWWNNGGNLHLLKAGGEIPFIQHDFFTLGLTMHGAFFFDQFNVNAFGIGGRFAIYPFYPISLEVRGGGILASDVEFAELAVVLGWHLRRYELELGYHALFAGSRILHSANLGMAVNF